MIFIDKDSAYLGMRRFLPIFPPVVLFGLIFGFTGGLANLPLIMVSSMSFIIFAGSAQFIVLLLVIANEPIAGIILAGVFLNVRHILYGAALHNDISAGRVKKIILAYLLTDEAYIVTTLVKKELQTNPELSAKNINLNDVLLGAGLSLWLTWNITTILGYLLTDSLKNILDLSPDFVVATAFLGYLIAHWKAEAEEHIFIVFMIFLSFILSFIFQSSNLLIITLLMGMLIAIIGNFIHTFQEKRNLSSTV